MRIAARFEIVVKPFPSATFKVQVSTNGGVQPRWRGDGKELYFIAPDWKLMAAPVTISSSGFEPGKPVSLFQTQVMAGAAAAFRAEYAVSSDVRFLIYSRLVGIGFLFFYTLCGVPGRVKDS